MPRKKSSQRWMKEHFDDPFVKQAQKEGYRSRAVFKLDEIQRKDRIITPSSVVVDLGAAPGGWSQYAGKIVGKQGHIIALDILAMEPIDGVEFIQGDFRETEVLNQLLQTLGDKKVDLVISDMAPNISGMRVVDQPKAMYLCELALDLAKQVLKPNGIFLVKLFQGQGFDEFVQALQQHFKRIQFRKPKASRDRSREVYALARDFEM